MVLQSILTLEPARRASNSSVWSRSDALFSPTIEGGWKKLSCQVGFMIVAGYWGTTHTLNLSASISLSVIFHGHSVLCCCAVLSSSCASFSLKGASVSSKRLVLMTTKKFCSCVWVLKVLYFTLNSPLFGVNLLFSKWWPFAVRHHDDIMNVQSETLEQSHHSEQTKTLY